MFPEILAPAGGREQLEAAIRAGADAVYLAGTAFGARSAAQNFERKELAEAIAYAHLHGVSVYVTVNTLIRDEELREAVDFVAFLYDHDVDAVIVQDIGLLRLIRRCFADLPLHASTQMTFHNLEGIRYAKALGFTRAVLPREMPIEEIERIAAETDMELEVFIHGALCMSYSGMCLMSAYIGGRSGNRGSCAQPCRKAYDLYSTDAARTFCKRGERILSPKDLSAAEGGEGFWRLLRIPKISLKIEGRLKGYDYVYNVVSAYRDAADGRISDAVLRERLEKSYNRGYTGGFLFSERITDFGAGAHTGNRGTRLGTVIGYDAGGGRHGDDRRRGGDRREIGRGGRDLRREGNDRRRAAGRGGVLRILLEDDLEQGDEVQYRYADGSSVGVRADLGGTRFSSEGRDSARDGSAGGAHRGAGKGMKRDADGGTRRSARKGETVSLPFRDVLPFPIRKGDPVYKTYSVRHMAAIDEGMRADVKRWKIRMEGVFRIGQPMELRAGAVGYRAGGGAYASLEDAGFSGLCAEVSVRGETVSAATGRGTDAARIAEQLGKLGGTPFEPDPELCLFETESGCFVPISQLNALRREMTETLSRMLETRYAGRRGMGVGACAARVDDRRAGDVSDGGDGDTDVSGFTDIGGCDDAYNAVCTARHGNRNDPPEGGRVLKLPAIVPTVRWDEFQTMVDDAEIVEIAHVSQLAFRGMENKRIRASYALNVCNSQAIRFLRERGVCEIEISPEIEKKHLTLLPMLPPSISDCDREGIFDCDRTGISEPDRNRITLMRLAYCPVGANFGGGRHCGLCAKYSFALKDEKGAVYPLAFDPINCSVEVLSPARRNATHSAAE